jgi:ATP-dependent DNA helicase RecQ
VAEEAPPGILYVATRRDTAAYVRRLEDAGVGAVAYHGGMPADERTAAHDAFQEDRADVIVATPAFGMGIDKPNVRFVHHAHVPDALDSYYQEVGRAGRDGEPARATLFFRNEDLGLRRYFLAAGGADHEDVLTVARCVRSREGNVDLAAIAEETSVEGRALTIALARLEEAGALTWRDDLVQAVDGGPEPEEAAEGAALNDEARERFEASRLEMMRSYAETDHCRGRFILNYFGEQMTGRCGHCDNCERGDETRPMRIPYAVDSRVRHDEWGEGTIVRYEDDRLVVLFDSAGYRTLALEVVIERDLLAPVE